MPVRIPARLRLSYMKLNQIQILLNELHLSKVNFLIILGIVLISSSSRHVISSPKLPKVHNIFDVFLNTTNTTFLEFLFKEILEKLQQKIKLPPVGTLTITILRLRYTLVTCCDVTGCQNTQSHFIDHQLYCYPL